MMRMD